MALNIPGVTVMILFYLLVLGIGIWASIKSKKEAKKGNGNKTEMALLGNRGISLVIGIFTMTATWVGGGFIVGTAEAVYNPSMGLTWAVMPITATMCFVIGGLFFAEPMRNNKYVTMMDPFQIKYGKVATAALSVASLISEIMWVTGTLIGLGVTMSVILDFSYTVSIWISAAVAITYTLMGGLYSVAYTDVIQLVLIFVSLWLCVPFSLMNPAVMDITETAYNNTFQSPWLGTVDADRAWWWIDNFLILGLGNLGLQNFHQRTLSAASSSTAKITCFAAAFIVPTLGIPPILLGAAAASTNWNLTSYGSPSPFVRGETGLILPIVLQHLTPTYISIIGIGAVAAAVMSSTDSALLSAASIFTSNIYKSILRVQASDQEIQWVIRISVVIMGLAGTSLTFLDNSVLMIWMLRADLTYTLMLPQLVCVLFFKISNGYGAVLGCTLGMLLRVLCGEPLLRIPPIIQFPGCRMVNGVYVQHAPIRTICMLSTVVFVLLFSYLASFLFNRGLIPEKLDVFKVKAQSSTKSETVAKDVKDFEEQNMNNEVYEPMLESTC
ncbi:high-affinity choline transporter 1-like isoform X1 [Takifugu rubripes]|uniref:High-affinity choline transporter 1-like n=1 Tax=Takifugu rubripes TaxID=31033 RepID=A0A674MTQ7_TAKRU|nr:high-affinity choline transporter 1-like isoform X1 [Takifugu rubripes]XP_056902774.1 high-affinity choline transporter 1-like isoform X1 [Takifugu flavidus]|eukprot:XP_003963885.1 PREDICTED: high-affinity choline transporter 1-like [Takifugu rubripes]